MKPAALLTALTPRCTVSEPTTLRGMAWDHPRARDPLQAIAAEWSRHHPVAVKWDARSLKQFEDQPLEELATAYDLILIDHPFVGFAATSDLIWPVDDWVDTAYLKDQAAHSVGPSYASYGWHGKQWALAIDAACQVSAVREDLWAAAGRGALPETWEDVAQLAAELSGGPHQVALPLNPNHAYCAFLSVGVSLAGRDFWPMGGHVNRVAGRRALEFLRWLAGLVHPASRSDDPIAMSDRMTRSDVIIYVPLMFGYSSYSRLGFRPHLLSFHDAPAGSSGTSGSVLGGVGLALSARSAHRELAADLARTIAAPEVQSGLYARAGGQPGHAAAWISSAVNEQTRGFFNATRNTMEQAFVRPRVRGHRSFQPLAGELIHQFLWSRDLPAETCLSEYGQLVESLMPEWLAAVAEKS
jgi:multiple sugar transport system substrate-binding protein